MTTDLNIEKKIQDKGLTAPRITYSDIESRIIKTNFINGLRTNAIGEAHKTGYKKEDGKFTPVFDNKVDAALGCLTICVLVLDNGFTVTGESVCASPENFDSELGQEIAYRNAFDKLWVLEGYLLKDRLSK